MSKKPRHTDFLNRLDDYSQSAATTLATGQRAREVAQKLTGVSLAAGAAGLTLTGGSPTEALIIHATVNRSFGTAQPLPYTTLTMEGTEPELWFLGDAWVNGSSINANGGMVRIYTSPTYPPMMAPLNLTSYVGPGFNQPNYDKGRFWYRSGTNTSGGWKNDGDTHFMGLSFQLENDSPNAPAGTTVYGWGEVQRINGSNGKLVQWAYEDSGSPIHVGAIPEANSLALFALGAVGVVAWRKRKKKAETAADTE